MGEGVGNRREGGDAEREGVGGGSLATVGTWVGRGLGRLLLCDEGRDCKDSWVVEDWGLDGFVVC